MQDDESYCESQFAFKSVMRAKNRFLAPLKKTFKKIHSPLAVLIHEADK